jgi:hypothetical protein
MTCKYQIDPRVRKRLDDIGEGVVRAKLSWIMNVTSLQHASVEGVREPLGDGLSAPLWAIEQWLVEKEARRQRWVKAAAILAGLAVGVALLAWFFPTAPATIGHFLHLACCCVALNFSKNV